MLHWWSEIHGEPEAARGMKKTSQSAGSKPSPVSLSLAETRGIVLRAQGLAEEVMPFGAGKGAVLEAVRHLGYVQVDTISVLQRAHHHVLWSRVPDYQPAMLDELQGKDAAVFEYWNHASSYLPTDAYRYSLPMMRKHKGGVHWGEDTPELRSSMRRMMKLVRAGGPLRIRDVAGKTSDTGWTEGSVSSFERRALHQLWMRGDLMIRERRGMEKVFDLAERVLPRDTNLRMPRPLEAAEFHVRRSLRALGVARVQEMHYLQDGASAATYREALAGLLKSGEVVEVAMAGDAKPPLYALADGLSDRREAGRDPVRFLSPFDNLVIQRKRLGWLFGFDYTVEIYVPAAKRVYGYFVLPILWGDGIIGRMDAKADRATKTLLVHNLVFEKGFKDFKALKKPFKDAMEEFMRFQGCERVSYARVDPAGFRVP